jgi:hypothetical protein
MTGYYKQLQDSVNNDDDDDNNNNDDDDNNNNNNNNNNNVEYNLSLIIFVRKL